MIPPIIRSAFSKLQGFPVAPIVFSILIFWGTLSLLCQIPGASPTVSATPSVSITPTPTPTPGGESTIMTPGHVVGLSVLATAGLVVCWIAFWRAVSKQNEKVMEILSNPAFFQVVTVMGVIAATVVLSLCDKLKGELTVSILSGIVGYVLGSLTRPLHPGGTSQNGQGGAGGTQTGSQSGSASAPGGGPASQSGSP
jgi:hypothetical protein